MADPARLVSKTHDSKARLVSIFAGAVLLPSIALSVLTFDSVPRQAEAMKITMFKRAEKDLYFIEKDLQEAARARVLEIARKIGPETLLEAHPWRVRKALKAAGLSSDMFESLNLEAASRHKGLQKLVSDDRDLEGIKEALEMIRMGEEPTVESDGQEDAVILTSEDSDVVGVLRYRFACAYAHGELLAEFFENEFVNPHGVWVVRVANPWGKVLYESAPTPNDRFEVKRTMTSPSFKDLKLYLRSRDKTIEQEIERWKRTKLAMIGFLDLLLLGGLFLVFSNVQRELRLSRLKSDFVANVSHELKTPLALIRLFSETLELGRAPSEEKKRHYYRVINKESHRLGQLINNILDFSMIEAGRRKYHPQPCDLRPVVEEVVEAYRFQIEQQGFQLEVEIDESIPSVMADAEAVGQALINLVNNAIKYSADDRHLIIALRRVGARVELSVADRGIGIASAEHAKVFEKFYRAESSLVHDTKGSGLGLALVQHIAEAHGGVVRLESAPGRGSKFTISLPIGDAGTGNDTGALEA